MQSALIVNLLEKLPNTGSRFGQVPILVAMHLLVFQCLDKRLARRVVPRIPFTRHADLDSVRLEQFDVMAAGVL